MEQRTVKDIDQLLEREGWHPYQVLIVAILILFFFNDAFTMQLLSVATPDIVASWHISASDLAQPMALGWMGAGAGAILGGLAGDRFGRKRTLIAAIALYGSMTIAIAFGHSPTQISPLRLLQGLGMGGAYAPALAFISECLPSRRRGFAVSAAIVCGPLGISACAIAGAAVIPAYGWILLFQATGLVSLAIGAAIGFLLPESPRHLVRFPYRREELYRVMKRIGCEISRNIDITAPIAQKGRALTDILGSEFRRNTLGIWLAFFSTLVIVSALLSWIPAILSELGYSPMMVGNALSAWSAGGLVGTFIAGWGAGRFSILRMGQFFSGCGFIGLLAITFTPLDPAKGTTIIVAGLAFAGLMFSGLITTCYTYVTGMYPAAIRATGVGFGDACGRLGAVTGSFIGIYAFELAGTRGFFGLICMMVVIPAIAYLLVLKPEARAVNAS